MAGTATHAKRAAKAGVWAPLMLVGLLLVSSAITLVALIG